MKAGYRGVKAIRAGAFTCWGLLQGGLYRVVKLK